MELKGKKIFISRKLTSNSPFTNLAKDLDIIILDQSLILIDQIRFTYTPQTNWIFFTSKNAIDHFFAQNPDLPKQVKHGVISDSSANHLLNYNINADFIGQGVNLLTTAKEFREILKNDSVLFPQAIDSYQTIQKQLAFTNTCYNLYVYKTSIRSNFDLPYCDILIFTSPSNVIAYYSKYKSDLRQTVIAIGLSTKHKLNEYNVINVLMPKSFDEQGLINCIT